MADRDEYDALLDEPFGSDVDWTAIDGMAGPAIAESDEYFNDNEVLDESFLRELRRLEDQAIGAAVVISAPQRAGMNLATRPSAPFVSAESPSISFQPNPTIPRQNIAGPSLATIVQPSTLTDPLSSRSTAHINQPSSSVVESVDPEWVLTDDRTQTPYFFDPRPTTSADTTVVNANTWTYPSKRPRISFQTPSPSSRRKRSKTSSCCSNSASPHMAKCNGRQKASLLLEAVNNVLQCPICFDTIAASHLLSCGHSACGLCLCEWIRIKGDKTTCCICRAPHRGPLIPNYTLDEMVLTYFNQKGKSGRVERGESDGSDRTRWEKRNAEGRKAVKAAAQKCMKKVASAAIVLTYGQNADPYDDVFNENDFVIW